MSIVVDEYTFDGPYADPNSIQHRQGVFVIHCCKDAEYTVVDVGASEDLRTSLEDNRRLSRLERSCDGTLTMSVLYISADETQSAVKVEERIRHRFLVPNAARGRHHVAAKRGTGTGSPE